MTFRTTAVWCFATVTVTLAAASFAQQPPYDVFPAANPPYYRVRYEGSARPGELKFAVNYTIWIPSDVKTLRGVIVHQHGCGEGSCKSGLTGALRPALAGPGEEARLRLLAPAYEQPEGADCQMWCDPRNGSDAAFRRCLVDLGAKAGHPELAQVPWALWGHSGGGQWAGAMALLHPDRVAAAWLRSGVPLLKPVPERPTIKTFTLPDAALKVPVMCNLGTKEGVTEKEGRFAAVWPAVEAFFREVRGKGGLIGVAIDPLTGHECGNQRYLAIPWLDACLNARLPKAPGGPLQPAPTSGGVGGQGHGQGSRPGRHVRRRPAAGRLVAERGDRNALDAVRQGHRRGRQHAASCADERARQRQRNHLGGRSRSRKRPGRIHHRARRQIPRQLSRRREESLRTPALSESPVQRHAHAAAGADAIHRLGG